MRLRFLAKDDDLVYVPNSPRRQGQPPRYVGRDFVPGDAATGKPAEFPASAQPFECDSDDQNGRELVSRFLRGKRSLVPADAETAKACGVPFVSASVKDGVTVAVSAPAKSSSKRESAGSES